MKIFVTGGTGLLGSHAAERFRGSGHDVVALCRADSDTAHLEELGCDIVRGDLGDPPEEQARKMEGCGGLLHAAAHIYGGRDLATVRAVNVDGTRNVLEGAAMAGVGHAVHVSSVAVYGDPSPPIHEGVGLVAPLRAIDFYGRTKREAEEVAMEVHGRGGLGVTVLRPPALYGERDRLFVPKLVGFLRRPVTFILGSGRTLLAAAYAGNVAQAVEAALDGRGAGEAFNVTQDVPTTLRDLLEGLARELECSPRFVSIPGGLARWGARVGDGLGIRIPGARDLSLSRSARLATTDNPYPAGKARTVLGWAPPFSLDEALARTGAWLRSTGTPPG